MRRTRLKVSSKSRKKSRSAHRGYDITAKIMMATFASIAFLMIVAAVGPLFIPTSVYCSWIEEKISKHLDARVQIDKFRFQILPYPGYTITGLNIISNDLPFQDLPVLNIHKIRGSLLFLKLLSGKIVTSISAEDASIDYRSLEGVPNFETMLKGLTSVKSPDILSQGDGKSDDSLIVRSIHVSNGTFRLWKNGVTRWTMRRMNLVMDEFSPVGGVCAKIHLSGITIPGGASILDDSGREVKLEGQVFVDSLNHTASFRSVKGTISSAHVVADFSVDHSALPAFFQIHLATSDLDPGALDELLRFVGKSLPSFAIWQGPVALNLSVNGTQDASEVAVQLDAGSARFGLGDVFAKGIGMQFKTMLLAMVTKASIVLKDSIITLGNDAITIKGDFLRERERVLKFSAGGSNLDGASLQIFFQKLKFIDAIEGVDASVDAEFTMTPLMLTKIGGVFKARRFSVAGVEFTDVESQFNRNFAEPVSLSPNIISSQPLAVYHDENIISVPIFKASFAGGQLSGSGNLRFINGVEFLLDGTAIFPNIATTTTFKAPVLGASSMTLKVMSSGLDSATLARNLKISGTLTIENGTWREANFSPQIFTANVWKVIEDGVSIKLDAVAKERLAAADAGIANFNAAFQLAGGSLTFTDATWEQGPIETRFVATSDQSGAVIGEGFVTVTKAIASRLFVKDPLRKLFLDSEGKFILPATVSGKLSAPEFKIDMQKLIALVKEKAGALLVKPAKEEIKPSVRDILPKTAESVPSVKKSEEKAAGSTTISESKTVKSKQPTDEEIDEMLKVIIGR